MTFVSQNTGYSHHTAIDMALGVAARAKRMLLETMQRRTITISIEHLPENTCVTSD